MPLTPIYTLPLSASPCPPQSHFPGAGLPFLMLHHGGLLHWVGFVGVVIEILATLANGRKWRFAAHLQKASPPPPTPPEA